MIKQLVNLTMLLASLGLVSPAYAAGRLTDADFKTQAQITAAGGTISNLLNTTKIYDPTLNDTLANGIAGGAIGGSGGSGGVELLTNPTFESGVNSGWTATGLTASAATSGTNLIAGAKSALLTPTATGQTFKSAALTVKGLAGGKCAASMYYIMSGAGFTLSVVDGSANVLASAVLPVSASGSIPQTVKFVCPASATATVQFVLTSTSASQTLAFDNAHLGSDNTAVISNSPINYVTDTDAESGQVGAWATYANTAQALPVTGTGGTSTNTFSVVNTAPLFGLNSYLFTHPASNTQGQGVAVPFTIDAGAQAKPLQINIPYSIASGTYSGGTATTDSDLEAYVYDVTNAQVIQPTAFKFDCAVVGTQCQVFANFQSASNSVNYRLILHNPTTTASAYSIKLDNILVTPNIKTFGVPASDLITTGVNVITATTTAPVKGTVTNDLVRVGRVGDHAHVKGEYRQSATGSGTNGSGDYLIALPSGMSFDPNKVTFYTAIIGTSLPASTQIGLGSATVSGSANFGSGVVVPYDATHFRIAALQNVSNGSSAGGTGVLSSAFFGFGAGVIGFTYDFEAPIAGWSSNVQMSDQSGDNRVVSFRGINTASTAVSTSTTVVPFTAVTDTTGSWNGTTFTVPSPGIYRVSPSLLSSLVNMSTTQNFQGLVYKNGVEIYHTLRAGSGANAYSNVTGSIEILCNAGDTLQVYDVSDVATTLYSSSTYNTLSISKISGNSQTAIGESVNATYGLTTAQSVAANAVIKYDTKVNDSHNAFNTSTGLFTAPVSGMYDVSVLAAYSNNGFSPYVVINGIASGYVTTAGTNPGYICGGTTSVRLLAGQTVGIFSDSASTLSASASPGGIRNQVSIKRTGN